MMKFYYGRGTCSLASHIALAEAGADYEPIRVDMAANEQRSDTYLAINPKGRVPSLVTEEGVLTETVAILGYVAQRWPQAKLAPMDDAFAFARMQSFNSYLASTVHVAHAHAMRGGRWADDPEAIESMRRKAPANVADCFTLIDRELLKGPWVMGEAYSVSDPYLYTIGLWIERDKVDSTQFPNVLAHRERMEARPAVQKALGEVAA